MPSRRLPPRRAAAAAMLAAASAAALAGCGKDAQKSPTYSGRSPAANASLAVVARTPKVTAWQLSVRFTKAGAPVRRTIAHESLNAFCLSGQMLVEAAISAADLHGDELTVPRLIDLPEPARWVCGVRDAQPAKTRADYVATALLAVRLTRS